MRAFFYAGIMVFALLAGLIAVGYSQSETTAMADVAVPVVVERGFDSDAHTAGLSLTTPIDLSVRGIRLDSTTSHVKKTLGKPAGVERDSDEETILIYNGLKIRFTSRDGEPKTADLIEINSTESDLLGLTIGSTINEVRSRLGREVYSDDNSLSYITTNDEPIIFEHDGKRVTRMTAGYEDNC